MNQPITETAEHAQSERIEGFEFTGKGGEFFRIWIVNLLLTIITVGIYSAWAKVRTASYFYGNTHLDGNSFRYLAKPLTILKGRLIAIAVLIGYSLASQYIPVVGALMSLAFLFIMPWLITRSLRFNALNSAYRNVRFNFTGSVGGAAAAFIGWPLLGMLTLGILFPLSMKKQNEYLVNNYSYGTTNFELNAATSAFFKAFFAAIGSVVLFGGASILIGSPDQATAEQSAQSAGWIGSQIAMSLMFAVGYLLAFAYIRVRVFNIVYGGTSIGPHRFEANMATGGFLALIVSNILLIAFTLGLAYPLARVRTARYRAEHLSARIDGSLDNFVAAESEKVGALGEELGDMMDLDVGL